MKKKIRKPGSGRTKGSFSFVKLSLGELKQVLSDDKIQILVSRKWAAPLFPDKTSAPIQELTPTIEGTATPAKVKVVDFNNETEEQD